MAGDKPYELTIVNRELYVYAHLKADEITCDMVSAYLKETIAACQKFKKGRLMIYRDIPEMLAPQNLTDAVREFEETIGSIKTAAVNPYLQTREIAGTADLANNGADYKVFSNFKAAEDWLLSQP